MRIGSKIAVTVIVVALLIRYGPHAGEAPDPERPNRGIVVLVVEEVSERSKLPQPQINIFSSDIVREYLDDRCAKDSKGNPEWRMVDKDVSMANEPKVLREAFSKPRKGLPWIGVSNGSKGSEGPLPSDVDSVLKLLKRYGGA
jgi:hypothetical protein